MDTSLIYIFNNNNNNFIFSNVLNNNNGTIMCLNATNKNKVVASLNYIVYNNSIFIEKITVEPEYKRCKLGSIMVTLLEQSAKQKNINQIDGYMNNMTHSERDLNYVMARTKFYVSLGYKITKEKSLKQIYTFSKTNNEFLNLQQLELLKLLKVKSLSHKK